MLKKNLPTVNALVQIAVFFKILRQLFEVFRIC